MDSIDRFSSMFAELTNFAISHLDRACRAASVEAVLTLPRSAAQPLVIYCSVGYRSSALAEKLQKAGLTSVWNLEGSIFAWADERRPVYRGQEPVDPAPKFIPTTVNGGQLLNKDLQSPIP